MQVARISYFNHIVNMIEITEGQLGKFAVRHHDVEETMICIQLILLCCPMQTLLSFVIIILLVLYHIVVPNRGTIDRKQS